MKKLFTIILLLAASIAIEAQSYKFPVDTLIKTGTIKRRVNIVILPDGYTAAEMPKFKTDSKTFIDYLFSKVPFNRYKPYFSVFTVAVPSNESGVTHPGNATDEVPGGANQPIETRDTYFGTSFDTGKIHRLLSYTKGTNLVNVLATNFPSYDIVFIIANTPYYGGAGGFTATFSLHPSSNEIGLHELGHSFPGLADEYYAGAIYEAEKPNQTKDKNIATNRWKNWLNTPGIGIFDHTAPGQAWAKPSTGTCRMEFLNKEFCSVCKENFVEKILKLITPVESQLPTSTAVTLATAATTFKLNLLKPEPSSLQVEWFLDGKSITTKEEILLSAASMPNTTAKLQAVVYDSTFLSRNTTRKSAPLTLQWNLSRGAAATPFIITANKLSLCAGDSITLTSQSCAGVVSWSNGSKGVSITAKPVANVNYTATCDIANVAPSNALSVVVSANPVITATNKGPYIEFQTIELLGTGGGTYEWKGSAGFSSTVQNPTIANAKVANAGVYTLTVKANNCQSTAITTVNVTAFTLTASVLTPAAACVSTPISLTFTTNGTLAADNKTTIQLSDNQGANFTNLTTAVDGSTLKATIPANTPAGTAYKVRVATSNPAFQSAASATALTVKPLPTAAFDGTETTIQQYQSADVKLKLTGDSPFKFKLSDGQSFDATDLAPTIKLSPTQMTEYKLTSVNNVCGDGTVGTGTFKITVTPVLGFEPSLDGIEVYPNPTNQSITVTVESSASVKTSIHLIDNQGKSVFEKETQENKTVISLQDMPAGTYFLRVQQGERVITKKIAKY